MKINIKQKFEIWDQIWDRFENRLSDSNKM
jgi:hypothetical protein